MKTFLRSCSRAVPVCLRGAVVMCLLLVVGGFRRVGWWMLLVSLLRAISTVFFPLRRAISTALILFLLVYAQHTEAQVVTTLAGSVTAGFADGTGAAAQFNTPRGVCSDGAGNLFVADRNNHCIRRIVIATGVVTTLAGSGTAGFADGTGAAALFSGPNAVCSDGAGNLFVADAARIRRIVIATGVVTTLAGSGTAGFADGTGAAALFSGPFGVCSDGAGNLFVADQTNSRIRRIVIATGVVTTLAGSGAFGFADGTGTAAQFNLPNGVCSDGAGNLFVTDWNNHRIRQIVIATGAVTTLAGSGTAGFADGTGAAAQFDAPFGVCSDGAGNLFVTDWNNHRIRRIVIATGAVTTLAGSGTAGFADGTGTAAQFNVPSGVCSDGVGYLFVADANNHRIRKIALVSPPTITSFTPTSGLVGTVVTITGTNFIGATPVRFGGVNAVTFTVDSPTQITATVPAGAVTGVVSVTTPGGTANSASNFTVTVPNIYYYGSGDPAIATNWRSDMGGMTGVPAPNFTTSGYTYIIESSKTATLTGSLTFDAGTTFTMQAGSTMQLEAFSLTLNGAINLGGRFGSGTPPFAQITIGGSGTITGNFEFNGSCFLNTFTMNRAGRTITLTSPICNATEIQNIVLSAGNMTTAILDNRSIGNSSIAAGASYNGSLWLLNGATLTNNGSLNIPIGGSFELWGNASILNNSVSYAVGSRLGYRLLTANRTTTNAEFPNSMLGDVHVEISPFTLLLNSSKTVSGYFNVVGGSIVDIGASNILTLNGSIFTNNSGTGFFSGGTDRSLVIGGSGAFNGTLFFSGVQALQDLTLNRAGVTIPLGSTLWVTGILTLTNGIFDASANTLTVANTNTNAISGGSAASYVRGILRRNLLPNIATDGTSYTFPVGDAGGNYRPFTLQNIRTGAGTPDARVSLPTGTPAAGTGLNTPFADASRIWQLTAPSPFISSEILLTNLPTLAGTARLGVGTAATGAYNRVSSTPSGTSISAVGQITGGFGTTNQFVAIGTGAAATYTWSGGAAGDWAIPTNWTPNRTTPATDDRLEILNPATLTINNVPNETLGQLIFGNGGSKSLSGAGTTLTLTGGTGDDFTSGAMTTTQLGNVSISLNAGTNLTVPANSSLGLTLNNTISGAGDVSIDGGFTTPHTEGLNGTSAATGAIRATGTVLYGVSMSLRTSSPNARLSAQGTKPAVNTLLGLQCDDNVALDKSVTVTGTLTLQGATSRINIGANTLTTNDFSNTGGAIIGSAASNLVITKTSALTSPLVFDAAGQTLQNLTMTGAGGFVVCATPLTIAGTLNLATPTTTFSMVGQSLTLNDFSGSGGILTNNLSNLTLTRTSAMTAPLSLPNTALNNLTLNGAGLQATLGGAVNISGILTLTNGILNTASNPLSVLNTATGAVSAGSATSYINGALGRVLLPNILADGTSYTFPVGDAAGFKPLNLNNVRTGVMSPAVRVTPAQTGATTPGMATGITTPFAEGGRNWRVEQISGNFNSATVELFANGLTPDNRVARSTAQAGPYDRVGQTGGGASVLSDAGQTPGYFAIGTRALQTVIWTGGGMAGNWNDPANWGGGPVPNGADFQARFNGGTITLTSGLPMNVGSLLVEGGAVVDLQQASTLNLTASDIAILVRGNSSLALNGTSVVCAATATGSVEAGSTLTLGSSGLTLGASGSLDIAGTLQRGTGALTGGSTTPVTFQNGSTLRYIGAGNVTTGAEFPATLPNGVTLQVQKTNATDVVTLNGNKNIQTMQLQQGRVAIPAGATFVINQNSTVSANAGFDLAAMSVLELNNCALSNANFFVGANGGINVQASSTLRLRDAASVTMFPAFYAALNSTLEYAGTIAKITTPQEIPILTMPGTIVVNNGGGVTLDASTPRTIQGGLTLTNGILTTPVALTLDQNATLSPGSATSHVRTSGTGTFGRILPPNLVMTGSFAYPIGDASGFRPFTLTNVSTGATPVQTALSTSPSGATIVGAGLLTPFVEMGRNWKFDVLAGTLSNAQITLQTSSVLNPTLNRVGFSASGQAGAYDRTTPSGGTVSGLSITSDAVNFPVAPVTRHFAIANLATTFYYISGDPALPASWRTDAAGTGGTPLASDFTTSGRTFIIPTPRTATLAAPLTFGTGVNFTMEAGTTMNGGSQALTLGAGGTVNIAGALTLDGTSTLVANATPIIQNGGTLRLVGNLSAVTMNPPLYLAGSTLQYDNRTAAVGTEFPPAPASNPMLGNVQLGGMMGASTMTFNSSTSITGGFTLQGASQLAIGGMNTDIQLGGAIAFGTGTITGTGNSILRVNGIGAVSGALNVAPPTALQFFDLSRPVRLALAAPLHLQTLALQGTLDTRTNATTLRLTGGSGALIINGGAVDGNLEWQLPANISTDGTSYTFPLSQGGTPRTITLQNIRTGANAPVVRLRFDSTGAMTVPVNGELSAVQPANWRVEVVSGDFTSSIIALNETNYQTTNRIGTSTAQAGQYERVSSGAAQATSRLNFSPPTATRFFAIGTASTNPKRYTLRNGGDPANPADWRDSLGVGAPDFITSNSEFVIPANLASVRLVSDLTLDGNVSLVIKAGAKLTIPDGRRLQLGSGGMLVEAGTAASMNIGGTVEVEGSGLITGGSSVYAGTTATLRYTGGGTKTATESEFPTNFGGSLELNRGGVLSLTQQRTIAGTLSLQNGILQVASAQALVLTNPQIGAITGGAANSYIAGALQRAILPNLRGDSALAYSFPVGSGSRFLPLLVLQPLTGTGGALFRAEGVADTARGSLQAGLIALSPTEFWRTQLASGSLSGLVQLGGVNFATANVVSSSASVGGVFTSARGARSGSGLVSERIALQSALVLAAAEALQPTVQSVSPTTALVGERITINGTNLAGVQTLDFGGTLTTAFQIMASQITVNVPQGSQTGALRIISAAGTLTAVQNFTVRTLAPPPTISTIQPPEAAPGARLTIQGTNLGSAEVLFRSSESTTQATARVSVQPLTNSTTQVVVIVPNLATSGTIVITTPNGSETSATVFRVLPVTDTTRIVPLPPTITGFSPAVADSGQTITIRGTNLRSTSGSASTSGSTTVLLGSTPARVISQSDTELTVQIPSNTASGLISVTTPAGTTTFQSPFTTRADSLRNAQNLLPQITALQPDSARVGDTIRILGRNLTGVSDVQIGAGAVADFRIISATEIRVVVPTGASSGFVALTHPTGRVQSPAGTSFTLIRPPQMATGAPTITGFSRDTVFVGDTLIVRGTNLNALTTQQFFFDTKSMNISTVLASTPTALTIVMPAPPDTVNTTRLFRLLVANSFGVARSAATVGVWLIPRQRMNPVVPPAPVDSARLRDSLALVSFFQTTNGEAWRNRAGWGTSAPMQTWFGVTLENNRVSRLVLPNNNLRSRGLPLPFENLTSLRVVNLSGNLIGDETGLVRLLALPNLEELQLAECAFAGRLDAVRPASASQPARTLCALTRLRVLNLAGNGFSGGLPTCLGDLTELRELNIANNALTGEIPSGLGRTARLLAEKGGASLTALTNLQSLNLSGNRLSGALPADLAAITTLRSLRLSQNRLTALPNLAALPLDTLTLGGNALTFAHLEQFAARRFSLLEYAGQDSVGAVRALTRLQGDTVTFVADIAASGTNAQSATLYEWLRNGVSLGSPRTAANGGHRLVRDLVLLSDAGTYSYRVTHPALTALTLVSRPQTLMVLPRENPVQTDTTATPRASTQPRLIAPVNDSRNVARRPTLRWTSVPGALRYEAEVRNASAGAASPTLERLSVQTDTEQRLSTTLAFETRFQWRVRAIVLRPQATAPDTSAWSENGFFTTLPPNIAIGVSTFNFGKVLIDEVVKGEIAITNESQTSITLRSVSLQEGQNEFRVDDDIANVRLQPGESTPVVQVSYQPRDTVRRSVALTVDYATGGGNQTFQAPQTLEGRGVPLEIRPLNFGTVLVGRTFLASAQVVNRSVYNLSLDSLFIKASNAASEGVFSVERGALVQSGRLFLGSGDTTTLLVRCRAPIVGSFSGTLRLASARIDTLEVPLLARARERLSSDIVAKIGIRAEPPTAKPGDTVRLRLYLADGAVSSLFQTVDVSPKFIARFRFDKYVLALANEQGGKARSIINTDLRNRVWRAEINARAVSTSANVDFLAEQTIPCIALNADVERTPLVLEYFEWGDPRTGRTFWFESADAGVFSLNLPRANGSVRLFAVDTLNKPTPRLALTAIAPNPAFETIEISYRLLTSAPLSIGIFAADGRKVASILDMMQQSAGEYRLTHRVSALPSGAYLLIAETPTERLTQRLEVVR